MNEDIPDLLLFPDADSKDRAVGRATADQRYLDGVAVEELYLPLYQWRMIGQFDHRANREDAGYVMGTFPPNSPPSGRVSLRQLPHP